MSQAANPTMLTLRNETKKSESIVEMDTLRRNILAASIPKILNNAKKIMMIII